MDTWKIGILPTAQLLPDTLPFCLNFIDLTHKHTHTKWEEREEWGGGGEETPVWCAEAAQREHNPGL